MENICTWGHVISHVPQYFNFEDGTFIDIQKARVELFINLEEAIFRGKIRPHYGSALEAGTLSFSTISLSTNSKPDFSMNTREITVVNLVNKTYEIKFSSATAFTITPDDGTGVGGTTATDTTLTDIIVKSKAWDGGVFVNGDKIFLYATPYEFLLIDTAAKLAAAKVLEQTFTSETSASSISARDLRGQAQEIINLLSDPMSGSILESVTRQDSSDETTAIDYIISEDGVDETEYSDLNN